MKIPGTIWDKEEKYVTHRDMDAYCILAILATVGVYWFMTISLYTLPLILKNMVQ